MSGAALAWRQFRFERRMFWRNPSAAFFNFALPLIFLDEPTTGFDPAARRAAWDVIRSLRGLGKTLLLTTHYLDEAQELADRVAIVKDGLIVAEGPPAELSSRRPGYHVSYVEHGRRVEIETENPTTLLHRLTGEALERGERLEGLTVTKPTLEDVYLELTADEESAARTTPEPAPAPAPEEARS